ncbi:PAS domain S-box protein [Halobacterium sp. KA-4]|uniref:sensor histidine kinase n=1 Tax=Halobacterium sp. KA-4 TaxID=2896367 RepID=UPI001E39FBCE|nr:ATP-binding protein [Halobacterium sp. KA-4]MCD2198628.1 PAS domain S-box protein [Halobacterium sp. KA-4]
MSDAPEFPFLDALDDVFLGFDEDGAVVVWNRAAENVTGYTDAELAAATLGDLFDVQTTEVVDELFDTGSAVVEADLVTADGDRIPYDFEAHRVAADSPAAFAGIGRDVTERHDQRARIEAREQFLREMYEVIANRQRSFTEKVEALLALGRDELGTAYGTLSKIDGEDYVFEIVDADDDSIQAGDVVPLSATNCERAASDEQTLVLGDIARDAPKETDRAGYTEWGISCYIGAPVFVDDDVYGTFCFYDTEPRDGQFSEWEVTLVDLMSRWVSYELQRDRANERLQRQNERLEEFASVVSHDLRNPLNVVEGSLELADETGDVKHLDRARRALNRMETLIDDLLTLARSDTALGETEAVDLALFSRECWETIPSGGAALAVETDQIIEADRTRLQQLLENVFRNAVEHGGDAPTVRVGDLDDGFYVEDDGPGIPEDERQTVFERGYSTTPEGTGFGLAIVAEIAHAHDWDVVVADSASGGARFEFVEADAQRA